MEWLQSLWANGGLPLVLVVVGLAVALVVLVWLFRKIVGENHPKAVRGRQPRLSVTDAAVVDDKRRLVLVRRDNVEHLVMIGGPSDIVIEQHIERTAPAMPRHEHEPQPDAVAAYVAEATTETVSRSSPEDMPAPPEPHQPASASQPEMAEAPTKATSSMADMALQRHQDEAANPPVGEAIADGHAFEPEAAETEATSDEASFNASFDESLNAELAAAPETPPDDTIAPPERPSAEPRPRSDNMEDEMQRLLDELSGGKPN